MQFTKLGLLAGLTIGALVAATPAYAQVTLKVWSIDGVDRPGIADTYAKEFDEANEDIVVEYRGIPFDELVNDRSSTTRDRSLDKTGNDRLKAFSLDGDPLAAQRQ